MYLCVWEGGGGGGSTDWKQTVPLKNQQAVTKLQQKSCGGNINDAGERHKQY